MERALACHVAQHTRVMVTVKKLRGDARSAMRAGDKGRAKQALKRSKAMAAKATKIEHLVDMCQSVIDSYADGEMVKDTVSALTDAQMMFNPSEANKLYEQLGKTTDDIVDARDVLEDVNAVLQESSDRVASVDADDLENELEALLRDDAPDDSEAAARADARINHSLQALPLPPSQPATMERRGTGAGGLRSAYVSLGVVPAKSPAKMALHAD